MNSPQDVNPDNAPLRPRDLLATQCVCGYNLATLDVPLCPECGTPRVLRGEEEMQGFTAEERRQLLLVFFAAGSVVSAVCAVVAARGMLLTGAPANGFRPAFIVFTLYLAGLLAMLRWSKALAKRKQVSWLLIVLVGASLLLVVPYAFCVVSVRVIL